MFAGLFVVAGCLMVHPIAKASDWPQFLGPTRDLIYKGNDLAASWPKEGPPQRWRMAVGAGFSAPVVQGGKLILFHRMADDETVECLNAATGERLWKYSYPTAYRDDFGFDEGPRATPTMADERVYTFGAEGVLQCLALADGKRLWDVQAKDTFQTPKGFFGAACSPLVVDGKVLLNLGAPGASVVAFEQRTGKLLWRARDEEASYSSPTVAQLRGKQLAVFLTRAGVVALEPGTGRTEFEFPWRSRSHLSVNAATPLVMDHLIFVSACYGTGAALLRVESTAVEKVWSSDDILSNHYATSVCVEGFLYGFHGRQESGPSLRCVELRTGRVAWSQDGFGAGTLIAAPPHLLVLKEDGQLLLLAASAQAYREEGRAQVLSRGVRAYAALADGRLYARSKNDLVCLNLREASQR